MCRVIRVVTDQECTIKDSLPQSHTGSAPQGGDYGTSRVDTIGPNASAASDPQTHEVSSLGYAWPPATRSLNLRSFPAANISQRHGRGTMLGAPSDAVQTSLNFSGVGFSQKICKLIVH